MLNAPRASHPAQVFVAVLGYSNYTYAEASASQGSGDWLAAHVRALQYFGGAPRAIVPDNLKSGVIKAHRYDPDLNRAYQDFAEYYQLAVLPARARKPRDKSKVESGVLVVERWILARLRNLEFFSLGELNKNISSLIERLNTRDFKKIEGNRRLRFEQGEKAALKPLPAKPYEFGEWRKAKVHPDYHIEVARAYYSVPYRLIGERVDVRLTAHAVEDFHQGEKVAAHPRAKSRAQRSTRHTHRPEKHIAVIDQHLERVLERALTVGPATFAVVEAQASARKHPEETLRSAQGILRLAHDFTPARLEAACERALALKAFSYRAVRTLIQTPMATPASPALDLVHENVRGAEYFQ
jgi:transposase